MMDDDLRRQLGDIDPMPADVPVDTAGSTRARALLEKIMDTSTDTATPTRISPHRRRSPWLAGGLAAASIIAVIAIASAVIRDDDTPATTQTLTLGDGNPTMSSCIPFDVAILADMPVAFGGTVTDISDSSVTVEVDRWYTTATGRTDLVALTLPAQSTSAALDGVDFVTGERYLLTATDGSINICGYSGPATPEFEAAFDEAFPG